ncbi:MAG: putative DNA binding domain-containing protein [Chloroflexi bacterium]|nr:putative DNA binding domain-containing protein [Chloroflexota bacterium]
MSSPLLRPPSQMLAYLPDAKAEPLAELLAAFANSDGGTIMIGVDEAGEMRAKLFPEEVESIVRNATRLCRPVIHINWEQMEGAQGTVYALKVARSAELHSLQDGRVLIRMGNENRPLGGDQIRQLAATKSSGDYELEAVPGATRDDLDEAVIAEYIEKRQVRQKKTFSGTPDEALREIGALDSQNKPTVVGMLLFGKNPQQFIHQSGFVFVKFIGTEPRGEDGLAGYGRREEITGPLARVIERAWQVIYEEMAMGAVVKGLEREEITEYPPFAVREALVNAVCHRDYRLRGRRIEVRMYSDRMELISPGGLPGFITVDNLVEEHFSRNPRIVAGLFQWGYIEELGLGIDRMIEEMVQRGHQPPKFNDQPHAFTVTLFNARERKAAPAGGAWSKSMNERQARALTYIKEHGSITNRDYRELCPDVSPETLRLDLSDLVDRGILLKIGAKKGTYYILK